MNKKDINIILDKNIWTEFLDRILSEKYDIRNFYQKILYQDVFDGELASFGLIFTIEKDVSKKIFAKMIFGFEHSTLSPKMMVEWRKNLEAIEDNKIFF